MTRHFVWLVPLINLVLFLGIGSVAGLGDAALACSGGMVEPSVDHHPGHLSGADGRPAGGYYLEAWLLVALGFAVRAAPVLERHPAAARRLVVRSVPILLGLVLLQAGWVCGVDRIKQWREEGRPLPPAGSPNVLLIVLDTVRADHLSLYGYPRPTTPNLERLARRGIRFDQARAAAPWTLASHANMFTGRWPHELAIEWTCPLRGDVPTLAEHLGSLGYATAGFVGNTFYCSYDSGLDRGFTHYEDYVLDELNAARTVRLVNESLKTIGQLGRFLPIPVLTLLKLSEGERKSADVVNREFLDWLSAAPAAAASLLRLLELCGCPCALLAAAGGPVPTRFGAEDRCRFAVPGRGLDGSQQAADLRCGSGLLARDAYDNCLAYLDERLGELIDDLERRGVLDQTLVIVTADHGEGLGEHGLFDHGESLYRTEIGVPLLFVLPADRGRSPGAVTELRQPARHRDDHRRLRPPGDEVAVPGPIVAPARGYERDARRHCRADDADDVVVLSELASPNPSDPNQGRSPAYRRAVGLPGRGGFRLHPQ